MIPRRLYNITTSLFLLHEQILRLGLKQKLEQWNCAAEHKHSISCWILSAHLVNQDCLPVSVLIKPVTLSAYKIISAALSMQNACASARDLNTQRWELGIVRDNGNPVTSTRDGATSSSACRPLYWPTGPLKHDGGAAWTSLANDSTANRIQSVDAYARCRA